VSAQSRLIAAIHPAKTLDETRRRAEAALNSSEESRGTITEWDRFRACLSRFLPHLEQHLLRLKQPVSMTAEFAWGRCIPLLVQVYGDSGPQVAFELVRTGLEGGLRGVLAKVAYHVADEYAANEIRAMVWAYWNGLSVNEKLAAADEFLAKYGHLLPGELTEGSAGRVRANLPKVLEEFPKMVRRLGQVGR
jgi:hypothetical protein